MALFDAKDFDGLRVPLEKPLAPGRADAAGSRPVALSNEDFAALIRNDRGAGAVTSDTMRAILASDDPAVLSLAQLVLGLAYDATATARRSLLVDADGIALQSDDEAHLGNLGGHTAIVQAQLIRAPSPTTYLNGDAIESATAGPMAFTVARNTLEDVNRSGRISGGRCTVAAASGTIVLPSFQLWLFNPVSNVPFASGSYPADNAPANITAAAMRDLVAIIEFTDAGWTNQLGSASATGAHIWQGAGVKTRAYAPFNITGLGQTDLLGLMVTISAWAPGSVQYQFDFDLDVDQD